jgi:hypothetical protein
VHRARGRVVLVSPSQTLHRRAVRAFPPPDGGTIFDIGGGNGFVARGLLDATSEVREISAARPMRFGGSCLVVAHAA